MSRIRTIKPEFFRHIELYQAEIESGYPLRVAFAGLWTVADREGRFRWRPEVLKLDILPFDVVDFSKVLEVLCLHNFISLYEVSGKAYGVIPTFKSHQVINIREAQSVLPAPELNEIINESTVKNMCMHSTRQVQVYGEKEKEKEKEKEWKNTSCSERFENHDVFVFEISLADKTQFGITQADIDRWQDVFPAVNIIQELKRIALWCEDNPTKKKTRRGVNRFISSWLERKQNKGGNGTGPPKQNDINRLKIMMEQYDDQEKEIAGNAC